MGARREQRVGQAHGKVATSFPSIIVHLWLTRMRDAVICTGLRALKPGTSALPSTRFQSTEAHEFRRKRRYFSNNCCPRRHHRSTDVQNGGRKLVQCTMYRGTFTCTTHCCTDDWTKCGPGRQRCCVLAVDETDDREASCDGLRHGDGRLGEHLPIHRGA